ncbi:Fe-S cluster assembly sulfur transfer protein SufU [Gemelliphila palaticanis]|uniref:SUF system NifU family Fe-S cluster assembly protein n=1 Tax=Gemelliphila palaticanis TaxID=81950 RepID=A0ABX2SYJ1_9BACL|nr:SUF system NifU family Fe-S cluster assembly protein [Gemella palaticanis]MBF0715339.1 SUF system NifU family Fe-S cluster assembly protein [Gemella palaticanis]NYS47269.1 SUF system NifU family Fe-S cluster assembly protein [Gemella palaticanis]
MSFSNLKEIYKQVILDHSKYPHNYGSLDSIYKLEMLNPSCGDKITISMDIENNHIKDIKFVGTGCSISMASASMLTDEIKGLSLEKAEKKINTFLNMIMGNDYDENLLEDSVALENISTLPARVKCATLAWKISEKIINDKEID